MIVTHVHLSFKFNSHCGGGAGRLCSGQGNFSAHSCPPSLAALAQEGDTLANLGLG